MADTEDLKSSELKAHEGSTPSSGTLERMIKMEEQMLDSVTLDPTDEFDSALIKMKEIHDKKKNDYSEPGNRFSNFLFSAQVAGVTPFQVFEVLISTKQARLISLTRGYGKLVMNEPLEDTLLDRVVYCALAYVYYMTMKREK